MECPVEIVHGRGEPEKSRSRKKRESAELQDLGEDLAALPRNKLPEGLPDELREALRFLTSTRTHEARRRQRQFLGRLMRELQEEQLDQIRSFLEGMDRRREVEQQNFHELEALRAALISEEKREASLADLAAHRPPAEIRRLRHLAAAAAAEEKPGKASRALFRALRMP